MMPYEVNQTILITLICVIYKNVYIQMNLSTKQKQNHRPRKQTYINSYQKGSVGGRDKLGVREDYVQSNTYTIAGQ